jgi:microsomal dipeptidase-like Zn-dependent dipeptidase
LAGRPLYIDGTQYSNWSETILRQMNAGSLAAVNATICYHENFRETVANISAWNRRFDEFAKLILPCRGADDIRQAHASGRTAIVLGLQNCSPIEDDIGLVEILHRLGVRTMQLSYNNQSLLASGCYEKVDGGVTRFGRQVIAEMNRVGMIVDMSHSGERSTLEAIEISHRPIAITHANPASWHPSIRNKSDSVLKRLAARGGMLGFSCYPHHLRNGSQCTLDEFCAMIARTAETIGSEHLGIGSDLCQDQPDSVVEWMRNGRWSRTRDFGEGSASSPGFPPQPEWFRTSADVPRIAEGLARTGLSQHEIDGIMGGNWLRFFADGFAASPR